MHTHKTYHVRAHLEKVQGVVVRFEFEALNLECGSLISEKVWKQCLLFGCCVRTGGMECRSTKPANEGQLCIKGRWFQPSLLHFAF